MLNLSDLDSKTDEEMDIARHPSTPPDAHVDLLPIKHDAYAGKRVCSTCKRSRTINKDCSLGVCKKCCIASTHYCKITGHRRDKLGLSKPYLETLASSAPSDVLVNTVNMVREAIADNRPVYISYKGGTLGSGHSRKITPKVMRQGKE